MQTKVHQECTKNWCMDRCAITDFLAADIHEAGTEFFLQVSHPESSWADCTTSESAAHRMESPHTCGSQITFGNPDFALNLLSWFRLQRATGSGGTGIGMSVVIFHPVDVLIQSNTITNGLGTGFCPP